ncbi:MAG: hypothetical protein KF773_02310 [Deltaproteobacteria bacterium]|nr:hypothetical protein [Deltaproteobacteria bacterium]
MALSPGRAEACGVVAFGAGNLSANLDGDKEPRSLPIAILGAGYSSEGFAGSVHVGWAWGETQTGGLFPGTSLRRVLLGIRTPFDLGADSGNSARVVDGMTTSTSASRHQLSLTYGWFDNSFFDLGLDLGVAGTTERLGPTAAFTLGGKGVDLRFTGGVQFGEHDTRFAGAAELVLDVMALARRF